MIGFDYRDNEGVCEISKLLADLVCGLDIYGIHGNSVRIILVGRYWHPEPWNRYGIQQVPNVVVY